MAGIVNVLCTTRLGRMLVNANDVYIGASLRRYGEYCQGELDLLDRLLAPGDTVVEAGANIGTHTLAFSRRVGAGGRVLAFEPQRLVFQVLCANLALNQCTNVWPRQAALGAAAGSIAVPEADPFRPNNLGGLALGAGNEAAPVLAVDDLALPACALIKADVEGMERAVVEGAARTIERHRPALYVENDRRQNSRALIEAIAARDYRLWWHAVPLFNPDNFHGEAENIFGATVSLNMLCLPRERTAPSPALPEVAGPDDWFLDRFG